MLILFWSREEDSNPQPTVYKTVALPLSYLGLLDVSIQHPSFYGTPCGARTHDLELKRLLLYQLS